MPESAVDAREEWFSRALCRVGVLTGLAVLTVAWTVPAGASGGPPASVSDEDSAQAAAETDEVDIAELDLAELLQVRIEVAAGEPQLITEAPAVASAITAEQIEAMGATVLSEVLETIPGLHASLFQASLEPSYSIRGMSPFQVLPLLNGVPIKFSVTGQTLSRMPVAGIARIEVIRGPGSAIYGADAVSGVINIITKNASDNLGTEVGARFGRFDTQHGWIQHGEERGPWNFFVSVAWQHSDGDRSRIIDSDLQTLFDQLYGTQASLAPGPAETGQQTLDAHLDLSRGPWGLHLWSWSENNRGLGAGIGEALDSNGRRDTELTRLDLLYDNDQLAENWQLRARLSYSYFDEDAKSKLFPPGARLPIGADGNLNPQEPVGIVSFPDGFIVQPGDVDRVASVETIALYTGFDRHRLRAGSGIVTTSVDTRGRGNVGPGVIDGTQPVVDATLTDVTDTPFIYMPDKSRDLFYVFLQDEWKLGKKWELTTGVRFDDYSDIGSTFNPRLALVWNVRSNLTAKVLYGSAFRAPTLAELFFINNPVRLGNPDLEPEEVDTWEMALDFRPRGGLRTVLNVFSYALSGQVEFVSEPGETIRSARNVNDIDGYGFELETIWWVDPRLRLQSNFAWQHSEDRETDQRGFVDSSGRQFYIAADWRFREDWSLFGQAGWIGDRDRAPGDPRPPTDDYTLTRLKLRYRRSGAPWEVGLIVANALDEDAREPSGTAIPNDFPLESRQVLLETRYHF